MKYVSLGTAVVLFLGGTALADDPPKKAQASPPVQEKQVDPDSPSGKLVAARKAYDAAQKDFMKVVEEQRAKGAELNTRTNPVLAEAEKPFNQARGQVVSAAMSAAKANPKSNEAIQAIQTAINFGGGTRPELIAFLMEHHVENPKVATLCEGLPVVDDASLKLTEPFLRAVIARNPDRTAKGCATLVLGKALMRTNPAEGEKLLDQVVAEYKDVTFRRRTLAAAAESTLFELRHLQIGMVAPDIEGEDVEGKKFKLSDYRGKVVMLDFWGHW